HHESFSSMRTLPGPATRSRRTSSGPVRFQFVNVASHSVSAYAEPEVSFGANVSHIRRTELSPSAAKSRVTRQVTSELPPLKVAVSDSVRSRSLFQSAYIESVLPSSPATLVMIRTTGPLASARIGITVPFTSQFTELIWAASSC